MKLNRKYVLIVALLVSLAMATTGTLAYLTDTDADVNVMTLGSVKIVQNEQERTESGALDEFTQKKPLFPAHYTDDSIDWAPESKWIQPGNQAWKVVEDNECVVDKFVTVTNVGESDAYIRTIIAYEGDATYGPEGKYIHVVHNGSNVDPAIAVECHGVYEIDGVNYTVYSYTYPQALAPDETSIPSLKQVYMDKTADNDVVAQYGDNYDILVLSQAIQTKGFTDKGADYALTEGFGEVTEENLATWLDETVVGSPGPKNETNNPPSPFAEVTTLGPNDTLTSTAGTVVLDEGLVIDTTDSNMGIDVGKIPLDVAYQFEPTMSSAEGNASEYAEWHADFVVSANKDIPALGIGLAGYYDLWCSGFNDDKWVMLASDTVIPANTEIRLVEAMGGGRIIVAYKDLCDYGNDGIGFLCGAVAMDGVKLDDETIISAPLTEGTTITVELRLYEAESGATASETGKYITTGVYTYTFE